MCGSVVDIVDRAGQWVGRGFYNGHSRIALRVLTTDAGYLSSGITESYPPAAPAAGFLLDISL